MKPPYRILANVIMISSVSAKLISPPTDVLLIYPTTTVNNNSLVPLGFKYNESQPTPPGLMRNISMSFTDPHGKNSRTLVSTFQSNNCGSQLNYGPGDTIYLWTNDTGKYIMFWNFTYTTSSDPSLVNNSFCAPTPPYSRESIIMNATFEVADLSADTLNPAQTHTTQLPTVPTAKVQSESGAAHFNAISTLFVVSVAFVILPSTQML